MITSGFSFVFRLLFLHTPTQEDPFVSLHFCLIISRALFPHFPRLLMKMAEQRWKTNIKRIIITPNRMYNQENRKYTTQLLCAEYMWHYMRNHYPNPFFVSMRIEGGRGHTDQFKLILFVFFIHQITQCM